MSDLSRLLDDVYGTGGEDPVSPPEWSSDAALDGVFADWIPGEPAEMAAPAPAPAPEAEPETVPFPLDDVDPFESFADSDIFDAPGRLTPPPAPAEEPRPEFAHSDVFDAAVALTPPPPAPEAPRPEPVDSDVFGAAVGLVPPPAPAEEPLPELDDLARMVTIPAWQPSDDDILPARRRGLSLSLRRR